MLKPRLTSLSSAGSTTAILKKRPVPELMYLTPAIPIQNAIKAKRRVPAKSPGMNLKADFICNSI